MGASKAAKIWRRTRVGGALATSVGLLLWAATLPGGEWLVLGLGATLATWGVTELRAMGTFSAPASALVLALSVWGASAALIWIDGDYAVRLAALAAVAALGTLLAGALRGSAAAPGRVGMAVAAALVIALPGLTLIHGSFGAAGLAGLILLAKIGDVVGYYIGSAIGRSHPFPNISPGKTTAGCVGSLVAGTLAGGLTEMAGLWPESPLGALSGWIWGAAINVASQAGDLLESALKRRAGVKDSGTRFGPSGGLLDLVDSLVLCVPVALLLAPLLFDLPTR